MDGQGNLERTLRVREKSGNLKINGSKHLVQGLPQSAKKYLEK